MIYSAVCLIADYSQLQKEITEAHKLNQAAYLDSLTAIPNRNGCDVMIAKYMGRRDVSRFGCALIELPKIDEINAAHGRLYGDKYINDFSGLLENTGNKYGFIGRNSGNEFLLIIEDCSATMMQDFVNELNAAVALYNKAGRDPQMEIELTYILNEQEGLKNFLSIISTLYSRERCK
jgi:diguanylate cyclase (GGDEF)-like protein